MSKALRVGIFVLATLLMFAGGIFLIGDKQFLFSNTYRLKAQFQNVAGLSNGATVRVGGIHQGTVDHIELPTRPDGKVTVVMNLKKETHAVIKKDSVASIRAEGLIGDEYVEISFGSPDGEPVKSGDSISAEAPIQISDIVKKANTVMDSANSAVQNISASAANLAAVSGKVNTGKGTIGALVNDRSVYQRVNEGATAFQEDMEALKHNFLLRGFFRNRGYESAAELTKHAIAEMPRQPISKRFVYDPKKIFEKPDNAKLKNPKAINEAGQFLEQNRFGMAVVAAYSGMKGDTEKERTLTQAQSMVVRDYLVQNFKFDDTRLKTIGLGKSADSTGPALEILVYGESGAKGEADRKK